MIPNTQHTPTTHRSFSNIWKADTSVNTFWFPRHIQEAVDAKDVTTLFKIKAKVQIILSEAEADRNYSSRTEKNYHAVLNELQTVKKAIDTVMRIEKHTLH